MSGNQNLSSIITTVEELLKQAQEIINTENLEGIGDIDVAHMGRRIKTIQDTVDDIRNMSIYKCNLQGFTQAELAFMFGISTSTASIIIKKVSSLFDKLVEESGS